MEFWSAYIYDVWNYCILPELPDCDVYAFALANKLCFSIAENYLGKIRQVIIKSNTMLCTLKSLQTIYNCDYDRVNFGNQLLLNYKNKKCLKFSRYDVTNSSLINYSDIVPFKLFTGITLWNTSFMKPIEDFFRGFDWTGVVLCGGAIISAIFRQKINDYDLWLSGPADIVRAKINYIIEFFRSRASNYIVYESIIEIIISKQPMVQIIYFSDKDLPDKFGKSDKSSNKNNQLYNIIDNFDMGYCRCGYDGKNVYGTYSNIQNLLTGIVTDFHYKKCTAVRVIKALNKGFLFDNNYALYLNHEPTMTFIMSHLDFHSDENAKLRSFYCRRDINSSISNKFCQLDYKLYQHLLHEASTLTSDYIKKCDEDEYYFNKPNDKRSYLRYVLLNMDDVLCRFPLKTLFSMKNYGYGEISEILDLNKQ
jgi:hypothetical protein